MSYSILFYKPTSTCQKAAVFNNFLLFFSIKRKTSFINDDMNYELRQDFSDVVSHIDANLVITLLVWTKGHSP